MTNIYFIFLTLIFVTQPKRNNKKKINNDILCWKINRRKKLKSH